MAAAVPDFKPQILDAIGVLLKNERAERNYFKERAYVKALSLLNSPAAPAKITSLDDIAHLGIGKGTLVKIGEVIATGSLAAAEEIRTHGTIFVAEELMKVHGIGPVKARELIKKDGIRSIAELKARQDELLNATQKLGLKYMEDIQLRIPRKEMEKHKKLLQTYMCREWTFDIVGSYRRGQPDSGDIDVLMTLPDSIPEAERREMFAGVIATLKVIGYIVAPLAEGEKKFMGIVKLPAPARPSTAAVPPPPPKARRLDLMLTPAAEYGYGLLYFTGSDKFNIQVRAQALKKGYTMNEHKLTPLSANTPPPPIMKTESEILAFLGIPYVKPEDRTEKKLLV